MMPLVKDQVLACAQALYEWPAGDDVASWLFAKERRDQVETWFCDFQDDLYRSKKGYPSKNVHHAPELEDRLKDLLSAAPFALVEKKRVPTLCLTHDIDYLHSTLQMRVKRLIGYRKVMWKAADYLRSIRRMLEMEHTVTGQKGTTTVFVACPERVPQPKKRLIQWLIDPSYRVHQDRFRDLLELLNEFECEIGLHGSFFSLEESLLSTEREKLGRGSNRSVKAGRQHWLNLSSTKPFERIAGSGITIDSTLGWNGNYGFRGGFARPFPIVLDNGNALWELPLVLMDGPLFEDLALNAEEVVERSIGVLEQVKARRGCVSINWHDRAADPDYGWFESYEHIVRWAKENQFQFKTVSEAPHV